MIYALDRVHWLEVKDKGFKYPSDFIPEVFFEDCFGIIADQNIDVETVKIKVSVGQANYLRSLTLHQTQKEIERNDEYSIFTVKLRPTFEAAILRCWSLNGFVMRWQRFPNTCGINIRMTNEKLCSNRF